jgi:hypothetical protein
MTAVKAMEWRHGEKVSTSKANGWAVIRMAQESCTSRTEATTRENSVAMSCMATGYTAG